ncbi:MAG: neutral/alkaline non-lysosomal ceramidase N-terminal domain-containing protein [Planctomycetota bacterium]|nr:neutral/alkaline non-lysosomal ceramidase N-terminal domain-containing protein [Planctomycetota bacterium]
MKPFLFHAIMLSLCVGTTAGRIRSEEIPASIKSETSDYIFNVGVATVDITPAEEVTLAGSPSPQKTSSVDTPLFVKAMVISVGEQTLAIVTLDTLKYPTDLALQTRKHIEETTHIPASNIIICASHTHFGPLWSYYKDRLITPIAKAVALAVNDLTPCKIGTSKGKIEGVSRNRRVLIDGECWNRWQVKPSERDTYPAAGPADPELVILAVVGKDGRYKAILYNYACHPANTRGAMISADYPGHVQQYVQEHLEYEVPTLFLLGSCGDVNPNYIKRRAILGEKIGEEILESLGRIEFIVRPTIGIESRKEELPGRKHPEFNEEEVSLKWKGQLEHYRKAFEQMKQRQRPTCKAIFTGIRIGEEFAIVTNPVELFCEIGMSIKDRSHFKNTMVATLTNGDCGYVPTAKAFEVGGYETWYGEHSFLAFRTGEMIKGESLDMLRQLEK